MDTQKHTKKRKRKVNQTSECQSEVCPMNFFTKCHGTEHLASKICRSISGMDAIAYASTCQCFDVRETAKSEKKSLALKVLRSAANKFFGNGHVNLSQRQSSRSDIVIDRDTLVIGFFVTCQGNAVIVLENQADGCHFLQRYDFHNSDQRFVLTNRVTALDLSEADSEHKAKMIGNGNLTVIWLKVGIKTVCEVRSTKDLTLISRLEKNHGHEDFDKAQILRNAWSFFWINRPTEKGDELVQYRFHSKRKSFTEIRLGLNNVSVYCAVRIMPRYLESDGIVGLLAKRLPCSSRPRLQTFVEVWHLKTKSMLCAVRIPARVQSSEVVRFDFRLADGGSIILVKMRHANGHHVIRWCPIPHPWSSEVPTSPRLRHERFIKFNLREEKWLLPEYYSMPMASKYECSKAIIGGYISCEGQKPGCFYVTLQNGSGPPVFPDPGRPIPHRWDAFRFSNSQEENVEVKGVVSMKGVFVASLRGDGRSSKEFPAFELQFYRA